MNRNPKSCAFAVAALAAGLAGSVVEAAPLVVTSYDMNNGAHGNFDYRDFNYTNCQGVCDTTNASLSGGVGKLTDGVLPSLSWYQYGESTPWMGWDSTQGQTDPTVTFHFAGTVHIGSIMVWADNALGYGGVWHPDWISVDGQVFTLPLDTVDRAPRAYTLDVDLDVSSVTLQFSQLGDQPWLRQWGNWPWLMIGEVAFDDASVPEPATLSLAGLALLGFGFSRRRKSNF